jgi:PAS domain S-box-containing protein
MPTELKHLEMNLMETAEYYRRLVEDMPLYVVAFQSDGTLTFANDLIANSVGIPTKQLIGRNFFEFLSADDQKLVRERLALLSPVQPVETHQQSYLTANGERTYHQWTNRAFFDAAGNLASVQAIGEDITERKRAEEELRLMQFSIDHSPDAVYRMTPDGRFLYVNKMACQTLGYSVEELLTMNVADIDPNQPFGVLPEVVQATKKTKTARVESEHKTKDGRIIPVDILVSYVEYEGKEYHCAFVRDISERKLIEDELQNTHSNLVAAQKLAQIGSWEWDIQSNSAKWSDETYRIFGIGKNKLSDHRENFLDMILPEDRSLVDKALREALDGTNKYNIVYRVCLADGAFKVIHALAEVVRDTEGKPLLMRGTVQDITQSKLAG